MQIVINISEEIYKNIQSKSVEIQAEGYTIENAILNGTPLPKGHGALKDFEKLYADMSEREELARQRVIDTPSNSPCYMRYVAQLNERTAFKEMLYDAPTIIEADKVESEDKNV